ncbi:L,D-transpeptidase family protein [Spirosoma validum]|uniref:L,D-transpeptidase family protein n=1 Tax=Spirosoma validum TaxID=2771355 RepID=A0A927B4R0_9BACT|nr:L,D-transpeptidase family protein [Spirosoma validum]MBD2755614.1 L,D-transpeptidase family protein [Spirosoma validum]
MEKRRVGIIVAVVLSLGILVYFGWQYVTDKAARQKQEQADKAARQAELAARKAAEKEARLALAKAIQTLHRANQYADSVGVDTSRYVVRASASKGQVDTLLTRVLTEIRYGKKPSDLAFSGLKDKLDSAWIHNPEAAIEPESLAKLSAFGPYTKLVGYYNQIRKESGKNSATSDSLRLIRHTLNFYRYINRFNPEQFVLVNIPAGELNVFDKTGQRLLPMQVIAGKPDRQTPLMTTYIQNIVMYPQWNVPRNIALEEMLPRMKRNLAYLTSQNLELIDDKGHEVNPEKVNWKTISETNFPYRVRQASGCDNSLGLLKFNLANPLAIYLHDTNSRDLFTKTTDRWRSHGCVRVQKPVELANLVLGEEAFDDKFMKECLLHQKPQTLPIPKRFPVFITYNVADIDESGKLRFYKDVYATPTGN